MVARNLTVEQNLHKVCQFELQSSKLNNTYWQNAVLQCNNNFAQHQKNITSLNNTLSLTMALINVWKQKDQECLDNLAFCQKTAVTYDELDRSRKAHTKALQSHSDCMFDKSKLLQNITSLQKQLLVHNELTNNLTLNNTIAEMRFQTLTLTHSYCLGNVTFLNNSNSNYSKTLEQLTDQITLLELDLHKKRAGLESANNTINLQEKLIFDLEINNKSASLIIEELLNSERNLIAENKALKQETVKLSNWYQEQLKINSLIKLNLNKCTDNLITDIENATTKLDIKNILQLKKWDYSATVVYCVDTVSHALNISSPNNNLIKVLAVSSNNIFNSESLFNRYNSLALCNTRLDRCRDTKHDCQMYMLKQFYNTRNATTGNDTLHAFKIQQILLPNSTTTSSTTIKPKHETVPNNTTITNMIL